MSASLPSLFVSHGAPTLALVDSPARRFLSACTASLPRPRAIVVVSAHWETATLQVLGAARPPTVHDFRGFPAELYALAYPAPGAVEAAAAVRELLAAAGITTTLDTARGFDHGAWVPLSLMYPAADVPVTQVSICPAAGSEFHWQLGRALAPLRDTGVLVVGSGAITHNLAEWSAGRGEHAAATPAYARDFAAWVADTLARGDEEALCRWESRAPAARRAHPSTEHLLPLLVAAGAAGPAWRGRRQHASFEFGVIGMDAYAFDTLAGTTAA